MRKIIYSVAMSLDGYLAGPNNEADWIVKDPEFDFQALMARFDTWLMGRRTFEALKGFGRGTMQGVTTLVASRTLLPADHPSVTVIGENLNGRIARIRDQPGKDIWLFGGGILFRSLLDHGLVDTVELAIVPVLLGGGVPILPAHSKRSSLRLVSNRVYKATGTVSLEYAVER